MINTTYKVRRNPYVMMNARYGLTIIFASSRPDFDVRIII
jgi:hypothetical protein